MNIGGGVLAGNKSRLIAALVLAAALAAAGIWYWQRRSVKPPEVPAQTIGGEIYEKAQNPLKDELPETNPFKTEANPFKNTETNPFIGTYENPFD
ncbi:MAG: hypothetical protein HY474_01615 [Candidatus Sungbacteria bacterium]|uniref:Uncharacterized protein n=1 Tax=Candidatus Sungiibacteriota bacterium TaxID=2750080 RepID=A0A932YY14_9BACT|nr:hypothetical protein [Candidatus Sungbacteria bacterium]